MSTRAHADRRDVETYIAELDLVLRGPRRVKRSLLVEAATAGSMPPRRTGGPVSTVRRRNVGRSVSR